MLETFSRFNVGNVELRVGDDFDTLSKIKLPAYLLEKCDDN